MATFESLRLCGSDEFDYFKPERLDPDDLHIESLYVAMYSLKRAVRGMNAAAVPLIIVGQNDNTFTYRPFNEPGKPDSIRLKFEITPNRFIHSEDVAVHGVDVTKGYIRNHNERLDGTPPEVDVAVEIVQTNEDLVLAG